MKHKFITKKTEILVLLIIILSFLIGMLVLSKYTSPLYPYNYGYDSAIFTLIGKGIVEGKIPYKDLFDHKGPLLFFIESLGYYIGKTTGILLIQCLFGIINLLFIYRTWKIIKTKEKNYPLVDLIFIFLSFFSIFFYTFESGNLSEEYSLPFISGCLYLFTKYAINTKKENKHPYLYSYIYGLSLMSLALIRINNAITIMAGILGIIIYLIHKKEYKNLLWNILYGLFGCLTIAIPFIIYFYINDALYEMIYATFIYNFKYVSEIGHNQILNNLNKYILLYLPLILSIILVPKIKKDKLNLLDFLLILIILFNIICLLIANTYSHYFTIYIPVFIIVIIKYWTFNIKSIKTLLLLLVVLLYSYNIFYNFKTSTYQEYKNNYYQDQYITINNDLLLIPKKDYDSIIGYNIRASYYLIGNIMPCYKYYIHQEWWSISNPEIKIDFINWLENENILWLITTPDEFDVEINSIISNKYELYSSNKYINLYRLRKEN